MNNKKKNKFEIYFFITLAILILYIQCHLSYVLNTKTFDLFNIHTLIINSILTKPFNILNFNIDSLYIWIIYFAILCFYFSKKKPKADEKWRGIEHGSNDFQTTDEIKEFLDTKTDEIINFTEEEIKNIQSFTVNNN